MNLERLAAYAVLLLLVTLCWVSDVSAVVWSRSELPIDGDQFRISLGVDSLDKVHAVVAKDEPYERRPLYMTCDSECLEAQNWDATPIGYTGDAFWISIDFDQDNRPRVVFTDENRNELRYAYCEGACEDQSSWATSVLRTGTFNVSSTPQLVVDSGGRQHVVYSDSNNTYYLRCDTNCSDGANWQEFVLDTTGWTPFIAVDEQGHPHIAYAGASLKYAYCNGTDCTAEEAWSRAEVDSGTFGWPSVALDSSGRPCMAYLEEVWGGIPYNAKLKYAHCNAGGCDQQEDWLSAVIDEGMVPPPASEMYRVSFGWAPSLVTDRDGHPDCPSPRA